MSEIKSNTQNQRINTPNDVLEFYRGSDENDAIGGISQIGVELEYNLYNNDCTLSLLNEKQVCEIVKQGQKSDITLHREPSTTTLEIVSDPFTPQKLHNLIHQIEERFENFISIARNANAFPSPFASVPHTKPTNHTMTNNERYHAFWTPPRDDMMGAYDSFLEVSIQTSVSYKNYNHLLDITRMAIALEPLLTLATDAGAPFFNAAPIDYNARLKTLPRRGRNGGVPKFYYTARTGADFIHGHIDHIFNNPHIFAAFDFDATLKTLPSGTWQTFKTLERDNIGPQTLLNYRQAQSETWRRTANVSEIRENSGKILGHRAEISSLFATGLQHQRITALLITYLIAYSDNFYDKTRTLLLDHGLDLNALDQCKSLLENNYEQATHHKNRFHDLSFGTKTIKSFALPFADIIEESLNSLDVENYTAPILHILRNGRPDWLVYREKFQTLDAIKNYLKDLPKLIDDTPCLINAKSCADFIKMKKDCLVA